MFEEVKEAFSQFSFLHPNDIVQLASIAKFKKTEKDEYIVRVGDLNYHAIIVLSGLLCHFIIDDEGIEKTLLFVPERMFAGSMQTIMNDKPADENIIALEGSLLLMLDTRAVDNLAANNIRIMKMLNKAYKKIIAQAAERIKFLAVYTPEERYTYFNKIFPGLDKRVKKKQIASYLGVTPSSYSRIKTRNK